MRQQNILIIDDDKIILDSLCEFLSLEGFRTRGAQTFKDALTELERESYSLVLTDVNMPGMGGREFLNHIKHDERLKHIPVVILSCSNADTDILQSYRLQAAGFATKPEGLNELGQIINGIMQYWFGLCRLPSREC